MDIKMRTTRIVIVWLAVMMLFLTGAASSFAAEKPQAPKIDGTSAIMIDATTGDVLYEKNADEKRDPASITKILTCLLIIENMDLQQKVTITEDSSPVGMNIEMKKGEVFTVEQLLYALMLPSANDAARQLAIAEAGSIDAFSDQMNARAKECGATDTHFTNPNGLNLPGEEHHRTTARDLSKITKEAMKNKTFRKIVATTRYTIPATNKSDERKIKTTNFLLYSKKSVEVDGKKIPLRYEGATGLKTGTTSVAGNCFIGTSKKDSTSLIAVVLDSGDMTRFTDAIRLMDFGYENYETQILMKTRAEAEIMKVRRGETGKVSIGPSQPLAVTVQKVGGQSQPVEGKVEVTTTEEKLTAPVRKGDVVGTVAFKDAAGQTLVEADAIALASVGEGGILSHIGIPDDMVPLFLAVVITVLLLAVLIILIRRNKNKKKKKNQKKSQAAGKASAKAPAKAGSVSRSAGRAAKGRPDSQPRRAPQKQTQRTPGGSYRSQDRAVGRPSERRMSDTQRVPRGQKRTEESAAGGRSRKPAGHDNAVRGDSLDFQSFDDFIKDLKVKMDREEIVRKSEDPQDKGNR